ncbi:MAG TPA: fumarylacetoacetate hydrolase family protein, partial [Kribbella sp.]|nr:fumarylacetoacetate hydrolase family protein [Kribbella sp.]
GVRPVWEIEDPLRLDLSMRIRRDGREVFSGRATTAEMNREPAELVEYLLRDTSYPDGVVLSTGTSIVPGLDLGLAEGDVVEIEIEEVGVLRTPVVRGAGRLSRD